MEKLEKEVLRLELQIGELIRIVANLNARLKDVEDKLNRRNYVQQIPIVQKIR